MTTYLGTSGNDLINRNIDIESDVLYGLTGNDTLIGGSADDTLNGGGGIDSLVGGAGDDTYFISSVFNSSLRYYVFDTVVEDSVPGSGIDTVVTDVKGYYLAANVENLIVTRGGDAHGNELNNIISGSGEIDSIEGFEGDDTIYGGGGNDILAGGQGNDSIEGGDGNDHIWGDSDLVVDGWVGNDVLRGGNGDDNIKGGGGNDTLYGDAGNDTLVAGSGDSFLYGGDGNDTYYITRDVQAPARLPPHKTTVVETATGGTDTVIVIDGSVVGAWVYVPENVENLIVRAGANIIGNSQDNNIVYDVAYGEGRSLIDPGAGNDSITGWSGRDWINAGDGDDTINGNGGDDLLSGDDRLVWADSSVLDGNDSIHGGTGNDTIIGNGGSDILFGDEGNDIIIGEGSTNNSPDGNDTISGGAGDDTLSDASTTSRDVYIWGRGEGADTLSDSGGIDRLDVLAGVTTNQVWLRHVDNNLEISLIGTNDKFTINNWYASAANQVESIRLSDTKTLFANKVDTLVNAMAGFTPPAAGQTTLPANYQTALNPVIAANWA